MEQRQIWPHMHLTKDFQREDVSIDQKLGFGAKTKTHLPKRSKVGMAHAASL